MKLPIGDYYAKEVDVPSVMQTGSGISAVTANIKYYRKNTTTYDFSITKDGEKVTLGKPRKATDRRLPFRAITDWYITLAMDSLIMFVRSV